MFRRCLISSARAVAIERSLLDSRGLFRANLPEFLLITDMFDEEQLASIIEPGLTVQQAIDLLLADDDAFFEREVHIAPPEPNYNTDEDSGDENFGSVSIDNLCKRQLVAEAEVRTVFDKSPSTGELSSITDPSRIDSMVADMNEIAMPSAPPLTSSPVPGTSSTVPPKVKQLGNVSLKQRKAKIKKTVKSGRVAKRKKKSKIAPKIIEWIQGDFQDMSRNFPTPDYSQYADYTAVEIFECFIDDEVINLITSESNRYAIQKNISYETFTANEIRCFLGIMFFSSYHHLPSKRLYWDKSPDTHIPLITDAMSIKRFEQILRCFHVVDNDSFNPDLKDKLWKIRPLIDLLKKKFSLHFVPERNLSYDESMVRYFGKFHLKQFIPSKPIRFGYKVWSLNTPSGYLVDFDVYQGKSGDDYTYIEKMVGKCAAPLLKMIENFPEIIKALPFHFYVDNLFTTFKLLSHMQELGYGATGTLRENRIPKSCPLASSKVLKKFPRGHIDSVINKPHGVLLCKWRDNSVVAACSNTHGINPLTKVARYSVANKEQVQVPRPALLTEYNKGMGGTDRMDQNVNLYRIQIRNRKWYWPLINWMLNVSLQNSWILHRHAGHSISQLDFRRSIVLTYLKSYSIPKKSTGPRASKALDESRFDRLDHFVKMISDGKRRRCAGVDCKTKSRYCCPKCDVGLCTACFESYHIRK